MHPPAPNPCSKRAQARSGCTTPPPALLVSSSCTTHHPLPQSLNIHHPQLTFRPWEMHHPPPAVPIPFHRGGAPPPPQLCPSKVGGGAPPPPSCAHPRWGGYTTPPHLHPFKGRDLLIRFVSLLFLCALLLLFSLLFFLLLLVLVSGVVCLV